MAGGTFIPGVSKVRPGLYMVFRAAALASIRVAERGTVILPLIANWGQERTFRTIEDEDGVMAKLGYDINDAEMLVVREAYKRAKVILAYRLNEGTKAKATWGAATATAKYSGTRGNDIIIKASVNVVDETLMDVKTYVDERLKDEQSKANIEDLEDNDWVTFSGTGAIPATAGANLANGTNGIVINSDYTEFLSACETQLFNVVAYPVSDPTLKVSFATWVKKLREDEGKKIVGVLADYNADYEGIINVKNGVILNDGTALDALGAVPWVAGATAGASMVQSLTYSAYEGAVDANPRLSNLGYINGLLAGQFVFQFDGEKTKVEQDINSLHTYDQTKNQRFSKNRVIRVLDNIANDLLRTFSDSYVGKIDNNADGQALLKQAVVDGYLETLQTAKAIQNLDKDNDFIIDTKKSVGDEVWAKVGVQPVDSMEKFYFDVVVR
jgi:hypothetical protein